MGKHSELVRESLAAVHAKAYGAKNPTNATSWARRHLEAWSKPGDPSGPIPAMILACADYADTHEKRFGSSIGHDYVLGKDWESIVTSIRGLLNSELGGLDGGTLDSLLCRMLEAEGFET